MSVEVRREAESVAISAGRYRLVFLWTGDRWTHRLESADGSVVLAAALESAESCPPVSPTYQDLHVEDATGHPTAMALGRFGHHHYSATFRVRYEPSRTQRLSIEVDVADRGPDDSRLAATYTIARPAAAMYFALDSGAGWSVDDGDGDNLLFERVPDDTGARVAIAAAGPAACRAQILAAPQPQDSRTRRLRYVFLIESTTPDREPPQS